VRLYSTKSLRPLGTLAYHRDGCQAVAFAHNYTSAQEKHAQGGEEEDSDEEEAQKERARWLASAGKDGRIALWPLMEFDSRKNRE
jgi:ASTRA-associated protein 1